MIRNYFKIAWRNIVKRKAFSLINILGLGLGVAICFMIVLFIQDERSFDLWRSDSDNVYRVVLKRQYPTRESSYALIPQSFARTFKEELPQVEDAVRLFDFYRGGTYQLSYGDQKFEETNVLITDPSFFEVFKSTFLFGDDINPLGQPNTTVLNRTTAVKYFGNASEAVGKFLRPTGSPNAAPLKITAVVDDWPKASHFTFNVLLSTVGQSNFELENYVSFSAYTYLKLNPNVSPESVEDIIPELVEEFASGDIEKQFAMSYEDFKNSGNGYSYSLQALKKIYLNSHLEGELRVNGNSRVLYIFAIIALLIIVIAGINFINLSTARAAERAKEVGIRKTFGSKKLTLMLQFLIESIILSALSMVLASVVFTLLIPTFNDISGKSFEPNLLWHSEYLFLFVILGLIIGVIAGVYPAFILSSFKPITALRGTFKTSSKGRNLRNSLVVFQFAVSVILIICTLIVNRQMNFMTDQKIGFNKDEILLIKQANFLADNTKAFKNVLKTIPNVIDVSSASAVPSQRYFGVSWAADRTGSKTMTGRGIFTDTNYDKTLGLDLVEGRFFSELFPADSLAVVLNESAVGALGLESPIGKRIFSPDEWLNGPHGESYKYEVVGVVKDFHFQSLHEPITPLVFNNASRFNNIMQVMAVHIKANHAEQTIAEIEHYWDKFVDNRPFNFEFLDAAIDAQYTSEARIRKVFAFFSAIAIFIACIGLLGLAAYSTQQRTEEIGVRKVLGASSTHIVQLLSKDFMRLVGLSALIALPVAWYVVSHWLENFTYRIDTIWDIFLLASISAFLIALLTVSFQAIKAATVNPVKSLRTE